MADGISPIGTSSITGQMGRCCDDFNQVRDTGFGSNSRQKYEAALIEFVAVLEVVKRHSG